MKNDKMYADKTLFLSSEMMKLFSMFHIFS